MQETMQKSKARWILRSALKRRTRRYRRRQVVSFYLLMLLSLLVTLGADHHKFRSFAFTVGLAIIAAGPVLAGLARHERLVVKSLDDRAQVRHGVNFDQLSDGEQKEILQRYRVWGYIIDPDANPDERQAALRLHATAAAFRFLRVALPCFVAAYWMVYLFVPAGEWRESLMDSPVLIMWLVVFVVNLPAVIELWTEPDEIGEPRAVFNLPGTPVRH